MNHDQFCELLPLYVVGALDGEELRAFERYVAENRAQCEAEIAEFQALADMLAWAPPPAQPSQEVFQRMLVAIEEERRPAVAAVTRPRPREIEWRKRVGFDVRSLVFGWVPWTATALLCMLVVVLTGQLRKMTEAYREQVTLAAQQQTSLSEQNSRVSELSSKVDMQARQLKDQTGQLETQAQDIETLKEANIMLAAEKADIARTAQELREQVSRQGVQVASLQKDLAAQRAQLELLMDPAILVAHLSDPKGETKAAAKVYWHAGKKAGWVVASNLPPVLKGQGKCLELWAVCGNEAPVAAGIGWTDSSGHGVIEVKLAKEMACVDKFAVTLEPAGGVPIATGPMLLIGQ